MCISKGGVWNGVFSVPWIPIKSIYDLRFESSQPTWHYRFVTLHGPDGHLCKQNGVKKQCISYQHTWWILKSFHITILTITLEYTRHIRAIWTVLNFLYSYIYGYTLRKQGCKEVLRNFNLLSKFCIFQNAKDVSNPCLSGFQRRQICFRTINACISKAWWDARVTWTDFPTATNRKKCDGNRKNVKNWSQFSTPSLKCNKMQKNIFVEPPGHRTTNMRNIVLQVEFGCLNERKSCCIKPLKKLIAKYPGGHRLMYYIDSMIEARHHCKHGKPRWTNSFNMAGTLWFALWNHCQGQPWMHTQRKTNARNCCLQGGIKK